MITVFTPAYNRAHTLHRVYESLLAQTFRDFEWLIVDDGSTDDTAQVVRVMAAQAPFFPVRYLYQPNQGKHVATNRAVRAARGAFFITLDSDDACKPDALRRLMDAWNSIPPAQRPAFKGVSCRCCRPEQPNMIIGTRLPGGAPFLDSSDLELRCRHRVRGELWGMTRRDVMLKAPYPALPGLRYYPEGAYWGRIGLRYRTRYVDEPLRLYYGGARGAQLTRQPRFRETYHMRVFMLSPQVLRAYLADDPLGFFLQAVGLVRDGALSGHTPGEVARAASGTRRGAVLLALALLPGLLLAGLCGLRALLHPADSP